MQHQKSFSSTYIQIFWVSVKQKLRKLDSVPTPCSCSQRRHKHNATFVAYRFPCSRLMHYRYMAVGVELSAESNQVSSPSDCQIHAYYQHMSPGESLLTILPNSPPRSQHFCLHYSLAFLLVCNTSRRLQHQSSVTRQSTRSPYSIGLYLFATLRTLHSIRCLDT